MLQTHQNIIIYTLKECDLLEQIQINYTFDIDFKSVYLVGRRIDMVPSLLSTDLWSLKPNKIRLTFSVFWEIKLNYNKTNIEILNTKFNRCIIKSIAALSYEQAQNIINNSTDKSKIANSLRGLLFISKILKQNRIKTKY